METCLYHHGVKGMKWGHRKEKRGGLPSARKIRRQINKANKNPNNNKHTIAVNKKVNQELLKTKEGKAQNNLIKNLATLEKYAKDNGGRMTYTKTQVDQMNKVQKAYSDKAKSIASKYIDNYASAMLKDLGYKDTKSGREYLKKKGLV